MTSPSGFQKRAFIKALTHSPVVIFAYAVLAFTGYAGPEPIRDYKDSKTVVPVPPPGCDWRGFYVGLNAGSTWSGNDSVDTVSEDVFGNPAVGGGVVFGVAAAQLATFDLHNSTDGFIGGAQIGYNWQFATSWVAGIETDIQAVGQFGDDTTVDSAIVPNDRIDQTAIVSRSLDYFGTARGRFGRLVTPCLLAYGTGGLAYGGVSGATSVTQFVENIANLPNSYSGTGGFSETKIGWTVGGGLEWMFSTHCSLKAEYLYYDLGSVSYAVSPLNNFLTSGAVFTTTAPTSSTSFDGHIVRAGLNFHF